MSIQLDVETASKFAELALGHVTREYPNKILHGLASERDIRGPRQLHPIFYGSYDWHSCVHGYWLMLHMIHRYPDLPQSTQILEVIQKHFTEANVATELAYFTAPVNRGFERPYGWAWLLTLASEIERSPLTQAKYWSETLSPLTEEIAAQFEAFLRVATYPVRAGTHTNSAFALTFALAFARHAQRDEFANVIVDAAKRWYLNDVACQVWEPAGDEFLSPSLMEAELMRRALPADEFDNWFSAFLPGLSMGEPAVLFEPAHVSDRSDAKIVHLDGLNLSRAWCQRSLANSLSAGDPRHSLLLGAAERHIASALPHVGGDYMGEHWLATFGTLALEA
jgi:hypothetical protein